VTTIRVYQPLAESVTTVQNNLFTRFEAFTAVMFQIEVLLGSDAV